nr:hypothetical protein [uncultured Sphingorhabdus sp.]
MPAFVERYFFRLVGAIWLLAGLTILLISRDAIAAWKVGDPDDQMRMVQVRDWLAGQSWWDITQYRMNAPAGGDMHWSRLVDVPLGAVLIILTPFLGQSLAEQMTAAIVPLFTMGVIMAFYAAAARRIFGPIVALVATGLLVTIIPFTAQVIPMRIDHHGWQLACFAAALWALFDRETRFGSAVILGLACALWIEISVEGLPFAALLLGLAALRWIFSDQETTRSAVLPFPIALAAIAAGCFAFFAATESWSSPQYCDALSSVHVATLAAMAFVIFAGLRLHNGFSDRPKIYARLLLCGVSALAGAATLWSIAPQCAGDAFAGLDPLVREYWFDRGAEGLPLWALSREYIVQPLLYLFAGSGALLYLFITNGRLSKCDKTGLVILFVGLAVIGTSVSRTAVYSMVVANIFAAALLVNVFAKAEQRKSVLARMGLRVAAVLIAMPNLWGQALMDNIDKADARQAPERAAFNQTFEKQAAACQKASAAAALGALPKASIMAALDTNPAILQFTQHSVVASGHHRNQTAMADVIRTFTGSPTDAARIIVARKIRYVVICDGSFELALYADKAPDGFLSRLRAGQLPDWLTAKPDIGPFKIYEVQPLVSSGAAGSS